MRTLTRWSEKSLKSPGKNAGRRVTPFFYFSACWPMLHPGMICTKENLSAPLKKDKDTVEGATLSVLLPMTLAQFVGKNALRNKRRSFLTVISMAFSMVLLTLLLALGRSFYVENLGEQSPLRLLVRHRVSLAFDLPAYYRKEIRTVPGVVAVVPMTRFGGTYIDNKPEHTLGAVGH